MTKKIFWDKGHGGSDAGAVGHEMQEKVLTHKIVVHAMNYLTATYTGFEQRTSRTGDQTVDLNTRDDLADNWGADAFVSVHINAGGGTGFESYIYNGGVSSATQSLQNSLHTEILAAMEKFGSITDRGKKRANFVVLRETNMPAVLTENLFIDTASDANLLKNESFLKAIGEAHAKGVATFLGLSKKEVKQVSTRIQTGGLTAEMVKEVTEYFINKQWWAQIQFTSDGKNPTVLTGGLSPDMQQEFETWLKERGWWYNVV
jgi:N-acetylmuramoyl-L-alanine amidase